MSQFKFQLEKHLRKPSEFNHVFQNGQRLLSRYFIIFYLRNNQAVARLGIVASKRKCRLSVHRNQLRRLVREQFRLSQHDISGLDLIVLLRVPLRDIQKDRIAKHLRKQLTKLSEL